MTTKPASRTLLHINWTRCDGRGLCTELLPRILARDDWGYPVARDGSREPVIPSSALPEARSAIDLCPRLALSMLTDADTAIIRRRPSAPAIGRGRADRSG